MAEHRILLFTRQNDIGIARQLLFVIDGCCGEDFLLPRRLRVITENEMLPFF
ncbi:MAG: hypothetical protein NXI25_00190 [bacterium]|nr:hypothetical protein [bacterium]